MGEFIRPDADGRKYAIYINMGKRKLKNNPTLPVV